MAKYSFDTVQDFIAYVEKYFSGDRELNYGDDEFEASEFMNSGDVTYVKFEVNDEFDALAVCMKVPAQDEWVCMFPKFSHDKISEMTDVLAEVNNDNHERRPDRHPTSEEKLEDEEMDDLEWSEVPDL